MNFPKHRIFIALFLTLLNADVIRYGILDLSVRPKDSEISFSVIQLENPEATNKLPLKLSPGKNILPRGEYSLSISKERYYGITTNFTVGENRKNLQISLSQRPINLSFVLSKTPASLYIDNKYIADLTETEVLFTNVPPGVNDVRLYNRDNYIRKKVSVDENGTFLLNTKGRWQNRRWKIASSFAFATLPGLNYFFHAPVSSAGFVYPSMVVYYIFGFAFAIQMGWLDGIIGFNARLTTNDDGFGTVAPWFLIGGMAVSGIIHIIFSGLGAINDMNSIFEPQTKRLGKTTLKLKWSGDKVVVLF